MVDVRRVLLAWDRFELLGVFFVYCVVDDQIVGVSEDGIVFVIEDRVVEVVCDLDDVEYVV